MSRFDPEKVEWPDGDTGAKPFKCWPLDREMVFMGIVPANAYRELYEAAEQMAEALEGLYPPSRTPLADEALANFRGEADHAE